MAGRNRPSVTKPQEVASGGELLFRFGGLEEMKAQFSMRYMVMVLTALAVIAPAAGAQANSNVAGVNLNAVLNPLLAVNATPFTVNFAMQPGGSDIGDSPITINTRWILPFVPGKPNITLSLYAYFAAPAVALTNGLGNNIPASKVSGSVNGGAYAAFTTASPFSAASLVIFSQQIKTTPGNPGSGQRIDSLDMQIDTSGLGLPAGTYTGVLVIRAQAI